MTATSDSEETGSSDTVDEKTWQYSGGGSACVYGKHVGGQLPTGETVTVYAYPVRNDTVDFALVYESEDGAEAEILGKFSPEDAEELARDLLERAVAAKDNREGGGSE